ncbi:MAG: transporter related, partial [Oscillospiraceae bacterium]|nr:transporter related [Oscillospiraceae bacterium]
LSGYDNLLFFGRLFGLTGKAMKQRAEEMLQLVNLKEDKNKLVSNYSGGMKKRLSLAIALLHDPGILILDEPTVGIDPVLRKSIWDEFETLRQSGRTIIVSTHVMDEAARCQRAALLYNGRLIENDSMDNLITKTKSGNIEELFFMAESVGSI